MEKISIIIPVYNVENFLSECIQSVLNQDYENIEVICIEDVSTDNSRSILEQWADKDCRIKVFVNEKNSGLSYARNRGIKEATGEYIMFLDSDDMLWKNALKELIPYAHENALDGIAFNMEYKIEGEAAREKFGTWGDVGAERTREQIASGKELFTQFSENGYWKVEACRYLWKREFLVQNNLRFYEKIFYEDNLFSFQCWMKAKRIANVNQQYYTYRRHSGTITSTLQYKHVESMFIVIMEIYTLWREEKFDKTLDKSVEAFLNHLFRSFLRNKSYFADYTELSLGTAADKFLFSKLFFLKTLQRKYAFLSNEKVNELKTYERVIVYGAGTVGIETIDLLEEKGVKIDVVAVTNSNVNASQVKGYRICAIDELLDWRERAIVVLAVVDKYHKDIIENLNRLGFENVMTLDKE